MAKTGEFVLVTTAEPKRLYCGPDVGWVEETPPAPPTPEEQAQGFTDKVSADAYAQKYGIKADAIQLS
jgi:hypothetical protein